MNKLILTAAVCLAPLCGFSQNLILNGSFEISEPGSAPIVNYSGWGLTINSPAGGIDNWSLNTGNWGVLYWYWGNDSLFTAQDGVRGINLTSGGSPTESVSQSFDVSANISYDVSYYVKQRDAGTALASSILLGAGAATGTLSQIASAGADWTQYFYSFTPDTTTTATLSFMLNSGSPANGAFLDNVSVVVVPEPSTMALVGLGGLALAVYRRRMK